MTSGWLKISLALLALAPMTTPARTLAELERALVRPPPQSTAFVEYRYSRLLKRAAVSNGRLEHRGAGSWVRTVDSPRRERVEIIDDEIRMRRGDGNERRVPLARAPQLQMLLDSLAALLEGRITGLKDHFDVSLTARGQAWGLRIAPRDPQLLRKIMRVDVYGVDGAPGCIEMLEPDGDASITLLGAEPTAPAPERAQVESRCRTVPIEAAARE